MPGNPEVEAWLKRLDPSWKEASLRLVQVGGRGMRAGNPWTW